MRKLIAIRLVVLFLLGSSQVAADDIFVNNQLGSDRQNGRIELPSVDGGPVQSIGRALEFATRSDRIVIANTGVAYQEMICLQGDRHSGSDDRPFVIEGNGAVLDGTIASDPRAWKHVRGDVFAMHPRRKAYQQLFSQGQPLSQVRHVLFTDADEQLEPMEWAYADGQILFRPEAGRLPDAYGLRHCLLQTGVTLYTARHVVINNLVLQGFQQDGINAHELARNITLSNIECRANGRSGLSVGGVSTVRVVGSHFYDNGRVQVRTEGFAQLELKASDVAKEPAPDYHARGRRLLVDGKPVMAP